LEIIFNAARWKIAARTIGSAALTVRLGETLVTYFRHFDSSSSFPVLGEQRRILGFEAVVLGIIDKFNQEGGLHSSR